jgi:hypothetical protein
VPGYRNSTAHALEIGLGLMTHPVDTDYFLHADKDIFSSTHRPTFLLESPPPPSQENPNNTFSFPTVQLFAVAVYME